MNATKSKNDFGSTSDFPSNSGKDKRGRYPPERYGDTALLDLSDSLEDILNLGDNSFDDKNFVPSEELMESSSEKIVAKIKRISTIKRVAKKPKLDKILTKSHVNNSAAVYNLPTINSVNLDIEFDDLSKFPTDCINANEAQIAQNNIDGSIFDANKNDVTNISVNTDQIYNENTACNIASDSKKIVNNASIGNQSINLFKNESVEGKIGHDSRIFDICQQILLEFRHYAEESSTRISILEEAMIKNGSLTMHRSRATDNFENSRLFAKSNRLPISNDADFNVFEKNLGDEDFKFIAVIFQNSLQTIVSKHPSKKKTN